MGDSVTIPAKTVRFFLKYASSDPFKFVDVVRRRAIEEFASAPAGIAAIRFPGVNGGINYEVDLSIHRMMKKYFFRTHEMFLERIFDRYLRKGATFIDIGANCGYWSAYALSRIDAAGEVHAFEPVPEYFAFVRRLAELNPRYRVVANNMACGARAGRLPMTVVPPRPENFANYNVNIGSSSLQPGFLDYAASLTTTTDVAVVALDDYVREHAIDLDRVGLIKIDVEGFESAVFDGMERVLAKPGRKVPILCEILTDLKREHPLDGRAIIARLEAHGYRCLDATNLRPIDRDKLGFEENIVCV